MTDLDPLNAGLVKALDLGIRDTEHLGVLRAGLSTWLTLALDANFDGPTTADLLALRDWIDGGCAGIIPEPVGEPAPTMAQRTAESMRTYMETKNWSAVKLRKALVDARLRAAR